MSFSALKLGGWAFGEILTSAQMNYLNGTFPSAVDGAAGGTYNNSAEIRFGGDFRTDGAMHAAATFACDGAATFNGNCTLGDTSADLVDVKAAAQFRANVTFGPTGGGAWVNNFTSTFNDQATFNQPVTLASSLIGLTDRQLAGSDNSVTTYTPSTTDIVYYDAITANRSYKIDETGTRNGQRLFFTTTNGASNKTCNVQDPSGGPLLSLNGATRDWAMVERFGAADWRVIATNVVTGSVRQTFADGSNAVGTQAIFPAQSSRIRIGAGDISAPRTYQINDAGVIDGMELVVANYNGGTFSVTIQNPSGTPIGVVSDGHLSWFYRRSSVWVTFAENLS